MRSKEDAWRKRDIHTKYLFENSEERDHLRDTGLDGRMLLNRLWSCEPDSTGFYDHGVDTLVSWSCTSFWQA